jgi:hypothetical protein
MGAGEKYKVIFLRRSFFTFAWRNLHTRAERRVRARSRNECVFGELKIVMVENISRRSSQALSAAYFFFQSSGARLAVNFEIYGRFI